METLALVRNTLLLVLLGTPTVHGSAGVWQFPAYSPSPRPLEAPTPRVARAAIPKDLVSGITVTSPPQIIWDPRLAFWGKLDRYTLI